LTALFTQTFKNLGACFARKNLVWHFLAFVLTALLVFSGFDWFYFTHTQGVLLQSILFPAVIIGGLLPMILPFILYAWGKAKKSVYLVQTSFAVGEAAVVGWLLSSFYKAFTGRLEPPLHSSASLIDMSREFQFGFLRHGIFWGWPSSHTTVAFAVALTVFVLYRNNTFVKYGAILLALYIGIGVSTNIHWFSDFVAGAILGSVAGVVVGKSFKKQ
jgi:membrane-associated phospholipid phosphatase